MATVQIFVSTVSNEFRSYRDCLRKDLDRPNVTIKVQEDFIATGTETLDKLDDYICHCDAVIHLVGDMTGAMAEAPSVAAIRRRYPDLGERIPVLKPFLVTNGPTLSYTQWEAWLALYHGKALVIAAPLDTAPRDEQYELLDSQRTAQQDHLERLKQVERYPEIHFASADRLAVDILRSQLHDILAQGAGGNPADPNLAVLARKVRQGWIDGVLSRSIAKTGLIDFEAILSLHGEGAIVVDAGTTPLNIYDQVSGSLLILGHPGAGKTTTALQITRDLLRRSERDASLPVPVVLNLSTWTTDARSVLEWIIKELSSNYHVPRRNSHAWIDQRQLVLVLDGLDEISVGLRTKFVESLNIFLEEHEPGGLIIAGGLDEYEGLRVKPRSFGALTLQPLGPKQIDACLEDGGEALAGLREAIKTDAALIELAKSPLMLSVMSVAYRNSAAEEFGAGYSTKERRAQIFETYVDRAFEHHSRRRSFSREAVTSWLSWIARGMKQRGQTIFLVENLQPSWLRRRVHLAAYHMGLAIFMSALFGSICIVFRITPQKAFDANPLNSIEEAAAWVIGFVIWGLAIGVVDSFRSRAKAVEVPTGWRGSLRGILVNLAIYGPLSAPLLCLVYLALADAAREPGNWLAPVFAMALAASYFGLRQNLTRTIQTTESLWLEWEPARRGALWGALIGIMFTIGPYQDGRFGAALVWWLVTIGVCTIFGGFRPRIVKEKTAPNQGIMLTWRNALRASRMAIPLVLILLLGHLIDRLTLNSSGYSNIQIVEQAFGALVFFVLIIFMWFGGWELGKHWVLRGVIGVTRQAPWNFSNLLNDAAARNLMRRAGGGYLFAHRLLQDHFAQMDSPPPARTELYGWDEGKGAVSASTIVVCLVAMIGVIVLV
ncbi:MAG: hypothetical protein ACI89J_003857, partial [Hyphomicrobiaceae bacterium]